MHQTGPAAAPTVPAKALCTDVRTHSGQPKLLLGGIALTLVALIGLEWLPARTLDLTAPGAVNNVYLAMPGELPDGSAPVQWVDAEQRRWRCHYTTWASYQPCGLTLIFSGEDSARGRDLRGFDSLEMDLKYTGPSPFVRVSIRNFDPRFSKVNDANSARIQSLNLRPRDVARPVHIDLPELTVPEWWGQQYDLPREYMRPSLENVTTVTVDLPGNLHDQEHEMQLRSLVLKGEWIGRDKVYLAILVAWLLAASGTALREWQRLRRSYSRQQREIDALTTRARLLRVEQEKLRRLATIDELTGVLNRRGLEQALDDFEEACQGMTILMMDIDHFKRVNDSHGHDCGDEVLRRVAAVIVANLRASDVFGRWGGEEFLIACQGTRLSDAARLADKLRDRIEKAEIRTSAGRIEVTASFGVALAPPGLPAAGGIKRADEALYAAKAAGRNRVEVDQTLTTGATTTV